MTSRLRTWGHRLPLLILLCPGAAAAAGIHLEFVPVPAMVAPHDTFTVEVTATPADSRFNAFDLNVAYDPARLTFVPTTPLSAQRGSLMTTACANTFHLFTPGAGLLQITLGLLCNNVSVTGPGVIYKLRFAATDSVGPTVISCAAGSQFYDAGLFTGPLDCHPLSLNVSGISGAADHPPVDGAGLELEMPAAWRPAAGEPLRLSVRLPAADIAWLELFDVTGRLRARSTALPHAAGSGEISWAMPRVASGVYLMRLATAGGLSTTRRWVVLR